MTHDPGQQPQYPPQPPAVLGQPQYPYQQSLPPVFPPGYQGGQPNAQGWYPPPQQFPRQAVSVRGEMSQGEKIAWAVAVMCTCGLALPFYLARRRAARRRTVTRYR